LMLLWAVTPVGGILYAWPGVILRIFLPSERMVSPFTMIHTSSMGWLWGCGMVCGAMVHRFMPLGPPLQMCTQCAPTRRSLSKRSATTMSAPARSAAAMLYSKNADGVVRR